MESNTETVAKRARVGPRTPVVFTIKIMFLMEILSTSGRRSDMIVLDNVLKINMDASNDGKCHATNRSIIFLKL